MPRQQLPVGLQFIRNGQGHVVHNVSKTTRKPIESALGNIYMSNGAIELFNKLNPGTIIPKSPQKSPSKSSRLTKKLNR